MRYFLPTAPSGNALRMKTTGLQPTWAEPLTSGKSSPHMAWNRRTPLFPEFFFRPWPAAPVRRFSRPPLLLLPNGQFVAYQDNGEGATLFRPSLRPGATSMESLNGLAENRIVRSMAGAAAITVTTLRISA